MLPLTEDRAKPAVPFGGSYRIIDFALSNFANSRLPEDRRAHPVQEPQPRPPHQPDLAVQRAARQLRHPGAGADASRAALVRRFGRRDLPEPQPHHRREPRRGVRVRRRPHLPHGRQADGRRSTCASGAGVTVAAIPVGYEEAKSFGVIEADETGKIKAFHEKSPNPPTMPGDDTRCLASMGNYVFNTKTLIDIVTPTGEDDQHTDIGGHIIPALTAAGVAARLRLLEERSCPARTIVRRATGATSAPSTRTTTPTWTCSRRCRCSTSTTTSGRCSPVTSRCRRRRSRVAPAASRRTSTAACCAPAPSSRARHVERSIAVAGCAGAPRRARHRQPAVPRCRGRPRCTHQPLHRRQERRHPARHSHRFRRRGRRCPVHHQRPRHRRHPQGLHLLGHRGECRDGQRLSCHRPPLRAHAPERTDRRIRALFSSIGPEGPVPVALRPRSTVVSPVT